jgi:hypothetical protein
LSTNTASGPRLLSHSEIQTALTCWAKWDFRYGGSLAGSTLKSRSLAPLLAAGRAWGAAVAAWHSHSGQLLSAYEAHTTLHRTLADDAKAVIDRGGYVDSNGMAEMAVRLGAILDHYMETATPLPNLTRMEAEFVVPTLGQGGGSSNTYKFLAKIDGYLVDLHGEQWIVEFKLRNALQDVALMERSRQYLWYAWALWRAQGHQTPAGVIVDERLHESPKLPATTEKGKKLSHKKAQLTTAPLYIDACAEAGVEPDPDTVAYLEARRWQQRVPLKYRSSEFETAGREIRSAARLIGQLDRGDLSPIRNASRGTCGHCDYRSICVNPQDDIYIDTLFERTVPKRLREPAERKAG